MSERLLPSGLSRPLRLQRDEELVTYDVYAGGGENGRMCRIYSFDARDDVAAEDFVVQRLTHRSVELWCRSRRVAHFAGKRRDQRRTM